MKVRDWLSLDEYLAAVDAARACGLPLDSHLPTAVPISVAADAGQRTVEHGGSSLGGLLLAVSSREREIRAEILAPPRRPAGPDDEGSTRPRD